MAFWSGLGSNWCSNTAQVHSSLADAILNSKDSAPHRQEAIRHLTTACEMFNACLEKQQAIYASYSALPDASMDSEQATGGVSLGAGAVNEAVNEEESMEDAPEDDEDSQYAVIQEPVTPSTILDTTIELLSTMSNLLPLLTEDASQLHVVQSTAESLASTKLLPLSTTLPERALEISITAAVLRCAIAESHLRSGADQDPTHWEAAISYAFDPAVWAWQQSFDGLCAKSDAHAALASALLETPGSPASMAWKHYAFASQALGNAATLEPAKASVYLARGDTELIRSRIENPQKTEAVRGVLLKNAGVFYRGAMRLGSGDIKREAEVKEAALRAVGGDATGMELLKGREARDILEEAVEDDVFEEGVLGLLEG